MLPAITIIGGTDSGKSTLIGNLLMETKSIPASLVQKVKDLCRREQVVFQPAYLVDYMREEIALQSTRETALAELKIGKEKILLIDTPGQMMLSKKMISGLSQASEVIILVDMTDNDSRIYRYYLKLAALLGFSEIMVVINKVDLFDYKEKEYDKFLDNLGIKEGRNFHVLPISALKSQNLAKKSELLFWYKGDTLLKILEKIVKTSKNQAGTNFLMPVQSVLRIGEENIALGTVLEGNISAGDKVRIFDGEGNKDVKIKRLYYNAVAIHPYGYPMKRGHILHNLTDEAFSNNVDVRMYVLEHFMPGNVRDYTVRFLHGVYKIQKLEIKERLNFQLAPLHASDDTLFANEFLDAQVVFNRKILRTKNIIARKFVIENKEDSIVLFGVISGIGEFKAG